MVFEPYQNNGLGMPSPLVVPMVWQKWNVVAGMFWSSGAYANGTCLVIKGYGGPPFYSLAGLKSMCPNAVVVGFGVNIGSYNPGYNVESDLVDFNGTTYDFELYQTPKDKGQCKDGGYADFRRTDGSEFKNQGDCVSYVNTDK